MLKSDIEFCPWCGSKLSDVWGTNLVCTQLANLIEEATKGINYCDQSITDTIGYCNRVLGEDNNTKQVFLWFSKYVSNPFTLMLRLGVNTESEYKRFVKKIEVQKMGMLLSF